MTFSAGTSTLYAKCDHPGCDAVFDVNTMDEQAARLCLREHGWSVVDDWDGPEAATFCITHKSYQDPVAKRLQETPLPEDAQAWDHTGVRHLIEQECDALKAMLLDKNRKYGNAALAPLRLASRASAEEQILVRIDDKLSRLKSAQPDETEDVWLDLLGYIVLLRVARRMTRDPGLTKLERTT